jgi:hypothetical protein
MSDAEFDLLNQACVVIHRMPREVSGSMTAEVLLRAAKSGAQKAEQILRAAGLRELMAVVKSSTQTLRSTGHFVHAETLERFASLLQQWDPSLGHRASGRTEAV